MGGVSTRNDATVIVNSSQASESLNDDGSFPVKSGKAYEYRAGVPAEIFLVQVFRSENFR